MVHTEVTNRVAAHSAAIVAYSAAMVPLVAMHDLRLSGHHHPPRRPARAQAPLLWPILPPPLAGRLYIRCEKRRYPVWRRDRADCKAEPSDVAVRCRRLLSAAASPAQRAARLGSTRQEWWGLPTDPSLSSGLENWPNDARSRRVSRHE